MTIDGLGGVSGRSGAGQSLAPVSLDHLQRTRSGMVMELMVELSIDLTIDYSGLEAGVGVAKRHRGCHHDRGSLTMKVNSS
jgi:hypothetical protein